MNRWALMAAVACAAFGCGGDDTEQDTAGNASGTAATSGGGGTGSSSSGSGQGGFDPAQDPVAQINHPGDMECRHPGNAFDCSGTGTDPQDGMLSGAALVWTNDVEGPLGTGSPIMFTPMVVGSQIITLTVTDSDGNVGTDQVTLMIAQQCP